MIVTGGIPGLRTMRIILDDEVLLRALQNKSAAYISGISYVKMPVGEHVRVKEKKTAVIDLTLPEEQIFQGFNETTRNEIRQAEKNTEFRVVLGDVRHKELYKLFCSFERLQKRRPLSYRSFVQSMFFSVYHKDTPISALACYESSKALRARAIFSARLSATDKEGYKLISRATRQLIWEACRYAKSRGKQYFDFGAVNFDEEDKASITRFKMSFGGIVVPEYTYTYENIFFRIVRRMYHAHE